MNPDRKSMFVQKRVQKIEADISNAYGSETLQPGDEPLLDGYNQENPEDYGGNRDTMNSLNRPSPPQEESKLAKKYGSDDEL